ncbi:hypothetical protein RJT34_17983 [Clitoria ternatea]|uniref:Uncharacterized protein n=1 Tax=Clitoria ternatea TaxID=43366 RepID=A0AAN9J9X7_CLITE
MDSVEYPTAPLGSHGHDGSNESNSSQPSIGSKRRTNWVVQIRRATTTEWAAYIDYRSEEKTKEICQKNGLNRSKQTIPHAGGSKKLKRRASEIVAETGQVVSRGTLYVATHKKKDGSYVNNEAQVVCEKILEIESQETIPKEVAPNDSLGQVFGKEHPGRTRGLGAPDAIRSQG